MPREKAKFHIEDVIVAVICPHCEARQASPHYPSSHGWDSADVKRSGARGTVCCGNCRERFLLPVKLLELFAGM